jgi:hypothetical protein
VADKVTKKILDFTNVRDRGNFNPRHKKEGDYRFRITGVVDDVSKSNSNDMWVFTMVPTDDKSATYPYRCTLNEESLWKIRNLFIAAGKQVPKKKVRVDPAVLVGKEVGVHLVDHEYNDRVSSQIDSVFPVSDLPAPSKKRKAAEVEDEVEEDVDIEEDEEIDVDDL